MLRRDCEGVRSDLVRGVPGRRDAVGADEDRVHVTGCDERRRGAVRDHGERDPERVQLPRGQARALEQRPRLVDPDVLDAALLPHGADRPERRAVPAVASAPVLQCVRTRSRGKEAGRVGVCACTARSRRRGSPGRARESARRASPRAPRRGSPPSDGMRAAPRARRRGPRRAARRRVPVRRCDADRRRSTDRQRADRVGDLGRGAAAQLDLLVRQPALVEHHDRVVLEPDDAPRLKRSRHSHAVPSAAEPRLCPAETNRCPCVREQEGGTWGSIVSPTISSVLVPAVEVLPLRVGELVDVDAHRRELEAEQIVVDVLRDVVDAARGSRHSRPPTRQRGPGSRTTCP